MTDVTATLIERLEGLLPILAGDPESIGSDFGRANAYCQQENARREIASALPALLADLRRKEEALHEAPALPDATGRELLARIERRLGNIDDLACAMARSNEQDAYDAGRAIHDTLIPDLRDDLAALSRQRADDRMRALVERCEVALKPFSRIWAAIERVQELDRGAKLSSWLSINGSGAYGGSHLDQEEVLEGAQTYEALRLFRAALEGADHG